MDGRLAQYLLQGEGISLEFKRCGMTGNCCGTLGSSPVIP